MFSSEVAFAIVMLLLCVAIVIYVGYRIITDPQKESAPEDKHIGYPFTSNPGDPMFPARTDRIGWVSYILLSIALIIFLSVIVLEIVFNYFSTFLISIMGVFWIAGLLLLGMKKITNQ